MSDMEMEVTNMQAAATSAECDDGAMGFSSPSELAQIFSGIAFIGLSMWLIFGNTGKIAMAQKASLEQRLQISTTINTAVCLFSGFFNILQLTKIDDFALPRDSTFVLDLSRPVEWILTCPIMQLSLVLLGGSRIPSYRRYMMPLMSVSVLLCGTASMFTEGPLRFAWYGFGLLIALIMFYHNALQIRENSEGTECLTSGSSDFRKLSIMVIGTWFPFPLWFFCSPEGFGLVADTLTIHMGWVVLNIISKFSFIIYMQRVKTSYVSKLEATRELYDAEQQEKIDDLYLKGPPKRVDPLKRSDLISASGASTPRPPGGRRRSAFEQDKDLRLLIEESMASLCMRDHASRLQTLLLASGIDRVSKLEALTEEECMDMQLPWNLVSAAIQRLHKERLEKSDIMVDLPQALGASCGDESALAHEQHAIPDSQGCDSRAVLVAIKMQEAMNFQMDARMAKLEETLGHLLRGQITQQETISVIARSQEALQSLLEQFQNSMKAKLDTLEERRQTEVATITSSICASTAEKISAVHAALGEQVQQLALLAADSAQASKALVEDVVACVEKWGRCKEQDFASTMEANINLQISEKSESLQKVIRNVQTEVVGEVLKKIDEHGKNSAEMTHMVSTLADKSTQEVARTVEDLKQRAVQEMEATLEAATGRVLQKLEQHMDTMHEIKSSTSGTTSKLQSLDALLQLVERVEKKASGLDQKIDECRNKETELLDRIDLTESNLQAKLQATDANQANLLSVSDRQEELMKDTQSQMRESERRMDVRLDEVLAQVRASCENLPKDVTRQVKFFVAKNAEEHQESMSDIRRMNMMVMDTLSGVTVRSQESAELLKNIGGIRQPSLLDGAADDLTHGFSASGPAGVSEFGQEWIRRSTPGIEGIGSVNVSGSADSRASSTDRRSKPEDSIQLASSQVVPAADHATMNGNHPSWQSPLDGIAPWMRP
eukprot:TRINITY_DN29719_c0_g1_i1.p1 TRINITY_DN29719_c0_g1~~TRINITY_DN29719_c0_g1_i1.p1  ORF type:complete len:950 (-),score=239.80 TRINITY_DN29719_c0_g1_i1:452-3301(-)